MTEKRKLSSISAYIAAFFASLVLGFIAMVAAFFVSFSIMVGPGGCSANGIGAIFIAPPVGVASFIIILAILIRSVRRHFQEE